VPKDYADPPPSVRASVCLPCFIEVAFFRAAFSPGMIDAAFRLAGVMPMPMNLLVLLLQKREREREREVESRCVR